MRVVLLALVLATGCGVQERNVNSAIASSDRDDKSHRLSDESIKRDEPSLSLDEIVSSYHAELALLKEAESQYNKLLQKAREVKSYRDAELLGATVMGTGSLSSLVYLRILSARQVTGLPVGVAATFSLGSAIGTGFLFEKGVINHRNLKALEQEILVKLKELKMRRQTVESYLMQIQEIQKRQKELEEKTANESESEKQ